MKELEKYIPLDKSWTIRMGILDLVNGNPDNVITILEKQDNLSDDLIALKKACEDWDSKSVIDVGESGTLYRFLQLTSWKFTLNKEFIKHGTLKTRDICNNPEIINYSLEKLLKLDNGTSQWASAAVLCGNDEKILKPPYKLSLSYEAATYWQKQKSKGKTWEVHYDKTIENQAKAFLGILKGENSAFNPEHSEDYCFARAFDLITAKQGEKLWPSLKGHESNRIEEMEKTLSEYKKGNEISSKDHRVVQAIAMKAKIERNKISVVYPDSVNKSWPQFWDFIENADFIKS